jgi:hypothetical protein
MNKKAEIKKKLQEFRQDPTTTEARKQYVGESDHSLVDHALLLQREIGNQAVKKLLEPEVGQASDSDRPPAVDSVELAQPPPPNVPSIVNDVLPSPGQPLDVATRAFFEQRFDHDFSKVRVHHDTKAAESAMAVSALAYTVGQDIVFNAKHYAPATVAGRRLMAHELAHVIQQSRRPHSSYGPSKGLEQSADQAASSIVQGQGPVQVPGASGIGLSRQEIVEFGPEQTDELIRFWEEMIKKEPTEKKRARYRRYIQRLRLGKRPTGAQAEEEMRYFYRQIGPAEERAYRHGSPVPRGGPRSKGSTKPDLPLSTVDIEVKARDITDPKNARSIIKRVKEQTIARREGGRAYVKRQPVILDLRGQNVTKAQIDKFVDDLSSEAKIPKKDIQVVVNKGQMPGISEPPMPVPSKTPMPGKPAPKVEPAAPPSPAKPLKEAKPQPAPDLVKGQAPKAPGLKAEPPVGTPKVTTPPPKVSAPVKVSTPRKISLPKVRFSGRIRGGLRVAGGAGLGVLLGLLTGWIQSKMEQKQIAKDFEALGPEIQERLVGLTPMINAYLDEAPGAKLYANITMRLTYINSLIPGDDGPDIIRTYGGLKLTSVNFSPEDIQEELKLVDFEMYSFDRHEYYRFVFSLPLETGPQ